MLKNPSHFWFGLFVLLVPLCLYFTSKVYFSYNFEDFYPRGDSEIDFYYQFREKFEHDDHFFLIAIENKSGVFEKSFLYNIKHLTDSLYQVNNIDKVLSITNYRYFIKSPFGYLDYPAVHLDDTSRYSKDKVKLLEDERVSGKLINDKATITTLILKINDTINEKESIQLVNSIKNQITQADIHDFHLMGKAYFQAELIKLQLREFITYSLASILLVAIIIYILFRKLAAVLLSLMNVLLAMLIFLGFAGVVHLPFNALSTLYPIVLIIVGISDIIHLLTDFQFNLKKNMTANEAMALTRKEIGLATFFTAITTAIGFLTLLTSNVEPIREFGWMSAVGVLLAYFVTFYFTALIIPFIPIKHLSKSTSLKTGRWDSVISSFYTSGRKYSPWILIIFSVVLFISTIGITKISSNTHIGKGLPKGSEVRKDYDFFEKNITGFRPFEIAAIAQDTFHITNLELLKAIDTVEQFTKQFEMVHGIQSTTLLFKSFNRANNGDKTDAYILPSSQNEINEYEKILEKFSSESISVLISEDKKCGRITATLSDVGTDSVRLLTDRIQSFINTNTDSSKIKFIQTGTGIIFDKNTDYLRNNLINGLCFGFIPISLLLSLYFRNWKMFFISSIPNLVPLVICGGIIGFTGIELDAPTSIIFGIIYGIAVDDTIHFLSRFKLEMSKGISQEEAIFNTFNETGKAVFTATLILLCGFSILMTSGTSATFNIGFLTVVTLLVAAVSDVYLLPLLLRKFLSKSEYENHKNF